MENFKKESGQERDQNHGMFGGKQPSADERSAQVVPHQEAVRDAEPPPVAHYEAVRDVEPTPFAIEVIAEADTAQL